MSKRLSRIGFWFASPLLAIACVDGSEAESRTGDAARLAAAPVDPPPEASSHGGGARDAGGPTVSSRDGGPGLGPSNIVVATRKAPRGNAASPSGLVSGTLLVRNDCLVLVGPTGVTTLPIFREGSAEFDFPSGTLSYSGRIHRLGERTTLPGGHLPKGSPALSAHRAVIERCATDDVFMCVSHKVS